MTGHRVELPEMLAGRERRAFHQRELHGMYPGALVCFTLNIAGPFKVFALSEEIFRITMEDITDALVKAGIHILHTETDRRSYGWEGYVATEADATLVKRALLDLEESTPAGRLFDIDVLRPDGSKVSREEFGMPARACLVCGRPTIGCARSRAHTVEEIQNKTVELFMRHLRGHGISAELIGGLCRQAMLMEVYTTPKPGLVDRNNNGSHTDMDVGVFERSTAALGPYFVRCAKAGMEYSSDTPRGLLTVIRPLGICAEKEMFQATDGVNTHKGMIFSMGILACAAGWVLSHRSAEKDADRLVHVILDTAGTIASPAWENDLTDLERKVDLTAGEEQYASYGIGGIRREAALGYPSVRALAWPKFRGQMLQHGQWELAGVRALMVLISQVTDTNIIHRSDLKVQEQVHHEVQEQLRDGDLDQAQVLAWDRRFIEWNISPGGCADLLALTYFLYAVTDLLSVIDMNNISGNTDMR